MPGFPGRKNPCLMPWFHPTTASQFALRKRAWEKSFFDLCMFIWVFPRTGKHPKMDGENNGKPYLNGWFGGKTHLFLGNTTFIVSTSSRHQKYLLTRRFYLGSDQAVFGINIHVSFGKECLLSLLLFSPTIFLNKSKVLSSMHNYWKTSQVIT